MLTIVFLGIENVTHRETLKSALELFDVPPRVSAGISYKSLRSRRLGKAYIDATSLDFPVILEAGVYNTPMSSDEALRTANEYYAFIAKNSSITSAIEFRHPSLSNHLIPEELGPKIIPAWDGRDPLILGNILRETGSVAAPPEVMADRRVPTLLHRSPLEGTRIVISGRYDLLEIKRAGFNAVLMAAWLTPSRFGEMVLWDGNKFLRSNRARKTEFVAQHREVIQHAGLDLSLLDANDARELNRLSAYSYISWAQALSSAEVAEERLSDKNEDSEGAEVVSLRGVSTKTLERGAKRIRPVVTIPVFSQEEKESLEEEPDGTMTMRTRSLLRSGTETIRVCDSCFLASTCPAYEAGASCAFNFPVEVRTDAQVKALLNSVMELQATRVAFARFAEEVNGGYPDAVVGKEMDRLFLMAERLKRTEEKRERLTVSVESESSGGGTGVLSRIFGERAQVEAPPQPAEIMADVVMAEIIED